MNNICVLSIKIGKEAAQYGNPFVTAGESIPASPLKRAGFRLQQKSGLPAGDHAVHDGGDTIASK
jgi:hypothetical protein